MAPRPRHSVKRKPHADHPSHRPTLILLLTAISRQLTRLCLSPVYGSVNTTRTYDDLRLNYFMYLPLLFVYNTIFHRRVVLVEWLMRLVCVLGCSVPILTVYVNQYSEAIGPQWGPVISAVLTKVALTSIALILFSTVEIQVLKEIAGFRKLWPAFMLFIAYSVLFVFEEIVHSLLHSVVGFSVLSSTGKFGLQVALSCIFAYLGRRKMALVTLPILLLSAYSLHLPFPSNTARLNTRLKSEGYRLIDRKESITGYISVLENMKDGFRVLRCDHSLLGGEWIHYPTDYTSKLKNPIYAIFVMLEAVRLVRAEEPANAISKPDEEKQALFIGLGVGTSPAAFIHHGIATDIVEIDPIVHVFATKYFDLPRNHTSIIEDAVIFIGKTRSLHPARYDFIIHDVFTGGAEPLQLFTKEFLTGLRDLLREDGTIAINYAGGLLLPSAFAVVKTVLAVFPTCRLFRETAESSDAMIAKWDLTNMVMLCRKNKGDFYFRAPVEADFLRSEARKQFLLPQHEMPISRFTDSDQEIITTANIGTLRDSQWRNALNHWETMRKVIPSAVWNNW